MVEIDTRIFQQRDSISGKNKERGMFIKNRQKLRGANLIQKSEKKTRGEFEDNKILGGKTFTHYT